MSTIDIEKNKDFFIKTFTQTVKRDGAERLLAWLESTDFFNAPASTRFHLCIPGGLCQHSLNVYNRLCFNTTGMQLSGDVNAETVAVCGLLHDLCKVNFYKLGTKNQKNDKGKWETVPWYTVEDQLPYGHGEKSVYIISGFMKLTREEAMAIRWHMGGFDDSVKGGSYTCGNAFEKYPLGALLHSADLMATYLDDVNYLKKE